ncbi:AraC family transcriptional regulator [Paraflavitalea pollutisoli]|uniref:AraC family transcriptional regulator n=1 Tax=Paraflavitalea pollutisoli TaxID=3034143 RepID=UPI0030B90AD4
MKKEENSLQRFETLSDAHRAFGLPQPKHPLISLLHGAPSWADVAQPSHQHVLGFYKMSYKPKLGGKLKYGQGYYDFDEGGLLFAAPGQVIGVAENEGAICSEYTLLVHPDFLLGYPLAGKIGEYGFFSYATHETLHLSEEEKTIIMSVFSIMEQELNGRIDELSQDVVISQIELLLSYANRFYKRQFITRKLVNHDLLQKLEGLLSDYFSGEERIDKRYPHRAIPG